MSQVPSGFGRSSHGIESSETCVPDADNAHERFRSTIAESCRHHVKQSAAPLHVDRCKGLLGRQRARGSKRPCRLRGHGTAAAEPVVPFRRATMLAFVARSVVTSQSPDSLVGATTMSARRFIGYRRVGPADSDRDQARASARERRQGAAAVEPRRPAVLPACLVRS